MHRAPPRPVRSAHAVCELVVLLLSKHVTCAQPCCNAMPSDTLCSKGHTSHFTLHSSRSALHTSHFTLLIPSHLSSSLRTSPHLSSSHLTESLLNQSQLFRMSHRQCLHTARFYKQKAFTYGNLLHREAFTNRTFDTNKK